jgi:alpha-galactosidase
VKWVLDMPSEALWLCGFVVLSAFSFSVAFADTPQVTHSNTLHEITGFSDPARCPFSFVYKGVPTAELLGQWKRTKQQSTPSGPDTFSEPRPMCENTTWTDPETGLQVTCEKIEFKDFPAAHWILWLENTGSVDTSIIEDVQPLDITLHRPMSNETPYLLHRTNGAPSNPKDFEASTVVVQKGQSQSLGAGAGRSSNKDFPFFKIESGHGSLIAAVGWSGQWNAHFVSTDSAELRVTAGLERTHFKLLPGERVRMPSILLLQWNDNTLEANAQFRQLIYKHFCARRNGKKLLPVLYCNTCFTRGGAWLNECNEQNQISLIKAYAPFNLEALLTDAGWFEGGWPAGAGNWTPRKDAYPNGMRPVAAAAKEHGMIYGLWFEPERVVAGTSLHQHHPEWLLKSQDQPQQTYLLGFGKQEVRDYFFNIVEGFMKLPGFRVYRQDFNFDPLPYWRYSDAADRQGITEIRYIEGLYAYWERIADTWPDSLRIECSSGGRRIDLETVKRMHIHQKSDLWFNNEVDQASIWGLSQYLPNNVFMAPINRMDDYTFHSVLTTSLCMGWIADAEDFDAERGHELLAQYHDLKHLLIGAWYPLLPYSRADDNWLAVQFHRPDLDEGMIVAYRRSACPDSRIQVQLHGLDAQANYTLFDTQRKKRIKRKGSALMNDMEIVLDQQPSSALITYKRAE